MYKEKARVKAGTPIAFEAAPEKYIASRKLIRYIQVAHGLGKCPPGVSEEKYRQRRDLYMNGFGSLRRHHSFRGGYITHVLGMLKIADYIRRMNLTPMEFVESGKSTIDWDFVFAGIMLHDIGKQATYIYRDNKVEFRNGCEVSHNVAGCMYLQQIHLEVEKKYKLSYAELHRLLYTIQNHDNLDMVYKHKRLEDRIISHIDAIDAIMQDSMEV